MDDDQYNEIKMDPMDVLFDKIHKSRGGEMLFVHVSEYGKDGPTVRIYTVSNKKDSILINILPKLVDNLSNGDLPPNGDNDEE